MDCLILAGNRQNYREVSDKDNKAFLKINERTILHIIIDELRYVEEIDRLLLVGPKLQLDRHLEDICVKGYPKPILVFEQKNDLVANILAVVEATCPDPPRDRYVLVLPSDIPLVTAEEIKEFIGLCDMDRYDYVGGLTTEPALSKFYPADDKLGVEMAYFYCEEDKYRINNLHMVRPSGIKKIQYVRKTYAIRYQKEFWNMLGVLKPLFLLIFKIPGAPFFYVGLQIARVFHQRGKLAWARRFQKLLKLSKLEYYISKVLDARFKMVVTTYGGSAIDVDNETDYFTICSRFPEWIERQKAMKGPGSVSAENDRAPR